MPLMQPQSQWISQPSQFSSAAQGYTGYNPNQAFNQAYNLNQTANGVNTTGSQNNQAAQNQFMSPDVIAGGAKAIGKFASSGFSVDSFLGADTAAAAAPGAAVDSATSFLPSGFNSTLTSPVPSGFGEGAAPITDALGSAGSWLKSTQGVLGGQAFGADGFAGSLGSSGLDLLGNGIANFGAGFLGTKLGGLLGNGGANANIGGTIGGTIGSYWGPVGSFVGSALGSVVGGFFGGGKTPHPAANISNAVLSSDGSITGGDFSGKHLTQAQVQPLTDDLSTYLKDQAKSYGIKYADNIETSAGYQVDGWNGSQPYFYSTSKRDPSTGQLSGTLLNYYDPNVEGSQEAAKKAQFDNIAQLSGIDPTKLVSTANANNVGTAPLIKPKTQGSFAALVQARTNAPTATA